jgi:hypothetical protein
MGEAEITRSTACTKEQLPRIASTRTQGGSSMNGFAGTNSSHGWDRASQRQNRWGDRADEAGASRLGGLVARGSRFRKLSWVDA